MLGVLASGPRTRAVMEPVSARSSGSPFDRHSRASKVFERPPLDTGSSEAAGRSSRLRAICSALNSSRGRPGSALSLSRPLSSASSPGQPCGQPRDDTWERPLRTSDCAWMVRADAAKASSLPRGALQWSVQPPRKRRRTAASERLVRRPGSTRSSVAVVALCPSASLRVSCWASCLEDSGPVLPLEAQLTRTRVALRHGRFSSERASRGFEL